MLAEIAPDNHLARADVVSMLGYIPPIEGVGENG